MGRVEVEGREGIEGVKEKRMWLTLKDDWRGVRRVSNYRSCCELAEAEMLLGF